MRWIRDARSPGVRLCAWVAECCVHATRAAVRSLVSLWATFGGANLFLNAAALTMAICCPVLLWLILVEPGMPLQSSALVSVDPPDRILDRDSRGTMVVKRQLCLAHGAWGTVTRYWVDGVEYKQPSTAPQYFTQGCHERAEAVQIPSTLPPGRYLYRVALTFCRRIGCEQAWLQEIPVIVKGRFPVEPNGPAAPLNPGL